MDEYLFRVEKIAKLIDEHRHATGVEACAVYAAIRSMLSDLRKRASDDGLAYAIEKVGNVEWHVGAMLGFDITNDKGLDQHYIWARTALESLRSSDCFGE
jgi:hypothetical protein